MNTELIEAAVAATYERGPSYAVNRCLYNGPGGTTCLIGRIARIAGVSIDLEQEGKSFTGLPAEIMERLQVATELSVTALSHLQGVHDHAARLTSDKGITAFREVFMQHYEEWKATHLD